MYQFHYGLHHLPLPWDGCSRGCAGLKEYAKTTFTYNLSEYYIKSILYYSAGHSTRSALIEGSGPSFMSTSISIFFQEIGSSGWYVGFILWTIILCLLVRFIGVYIFTFVANKWDNVSIQTIKSFPGSV